MSTVAFRIPCTRLGFAAGPLWTGTTAESKRTPERRHPGHPTSVPGPAWLLAIPQASVQRPFLRVVFLDQLSTDHETARVCLFPNRTAHDRPGSGSSFISELRMHEYVLYEVCVNVRK